MFGCDGIRSLGPNECLLDDVLHFSHVARPGVTTQEVDSIFGELLRWSIVFFDSFGEKMFGEERNVFTALPKRGQIQCNNVDAVVQVFAELSFANELLQVLVRGRYNAHIHLDGLHPADPGELSFLYHAKQLGLRLGAETADLVEEERPTIRELELSDSRSR